MDYEELTMELFQTMNEMKKARPQKNMDGIVKGESFVLQFLMENSSGAIPSDLSAAMGTTTARIAATLNSLDKKGLISRRIDNDDRRRIIVELTDDGKVLAKEQWRQFMEETEQMLRSVGDEDAKAYIRILKKMVESIKTNQNN